MPSIVEDFSGPSSGARVTPLRFLSAGFFRFFGGYRVNNQATVSASSIDQQRAGDSSKGGRTFRESRRVVSGRLEPAMPKEQPSQEGFSESCANERGIDR
jgi:hypothetical protein